MNPTTLRALLDDPHFIVESSRSLLVLLSSLKDTDRGALAEAFAEDPHRLGEGLDLTHHLETILQRFTQESPQLIWKGGVDRWLLNVERIARARRALDWSWIPAALTLPKDRLDLMLEHAKETISDIPDTWQFGALSDAGRKRSAGLLPWTSIPQAPMESPSSDVVSAWFFQFLSKSDAREVNRLVRSEEGWRAIYSSVLQHRLDEFSIPLPLGEVDQVLPHGAMFKVEQSPGLCAYAPGQDGPIRSGQSFTWGDRVTGPITTTVTTFGTSLLEHLSRMVSKLEASTIPGECDDLRSSLVASLDHGALFTELQRAVIVWQAGEDDPGSFEEFQCRNWAVLAVRATLAIDATGYGAEPMDLTVARTNANEVLRDLTAALHWLEDEEYDRLTGHLPTTEYNSRDWWIQRRLWEEAYSDEDIEAALDLLAKDRNPTDEPEPKE
jgi:hypothetical protein